MQFDVFGPFTLSRHTKKKIITNESLVDIKKAAEDRETGLSLACGCYVFAKRAGKGFTPWYVGQACKSSIVNEALNPANREKYNKILAEEAGSPVLFLLPMRTPTGKFRKRPAGNGGLPALDFLERWIIATAIDKNAHLINNKETKFLRNIHVIGVFNAQQGESTTDSTRLRKTLW
ncbi:hypothetical protein [Paraburkholderia solisilvae]|uniref:hypothetical protein n=1 Tax=Paraburkholderia solisilvae TaxID=624376 RepID=UPI00158188FB|nr:hypothetical protein [Paraburkholderia solisilvae]